MNPFVIKVLFGESSRIVIKRRSRFTDGQRFIEEVERRIFQFCHMKNPVFACGLLVTHINGRERKTLYVEETNPEKSTCYTSDLGGKTELDDTCLFDTLSREVWEESSHKFFGDEMDLEAFRELFKTFLDNSGVYLDYIPGSKYLLVKVTCDSRLPEECRGLVDAPLTRFDRMEGCISRKFSWVNSRDKHKIKNFHPRLQQRKTAHGRQQRKKYQGRQQRKKTPGDHV